MLQIRNIRKTYSTGKIRVEALKGISLDFPEKGLVFIVGKSGSGKSTLLNIIGGLDKMTSGEIVIDGKSTSDFSSSDFDAFRNYYIGFIFQDFNLIDEINVYDNIALALKIQAKGHDNNTIEDSLKMVGLEGLGYRKPNELSGGQRQRVTIARALVKDPHIILADEPTGALDSKTGEALIQTLRSLSKDKLVIVVTHDEEMALNYGDEIIEIKDGMILNHIVSINNQKDNNKEEILSNLVKYNSDSEILDEKEINSKLKKGETNYICINTSKETVSLAYSDAFPYLYESKENYNRYKENDEPLKEMVKSNDKRIKNKAKIKIYECIKMAFQNFKRKKLRFLFLILLSISSLSLFSLGWLLSSANVPNIVANKTHELNLPLSYLYSNVDDFYYSSRKIINEDERLGLVNKYNQEFAYSTYINLEYGKPFETYDYYGFSLDRFNGIIECDDYTKLNFVVEGDSSPVDNEILITDYAANELLRSGYIGKIDDKLQVIYLENLNEILNTSIGIKNVFGEYDYFKIVGIIDTDYEQYQNLISKNETFAFFDEEYNNFTILKNRLYTKIFASSKFIEENSSLVASKNEGDIIINYSYKNENDYEYTSNIYYYFTVHDKDMPLKSLNELPSEYDVVYGNIPSKLNKNEIIITYDQIEYLIEDNSNINEFMSSFNIKNMTFNNYSSYGYLENIITEDLSVVAVIDCDNVVSSFYASEELIDDFISKISLPSYSEVVFSLPSSLEAKGHLLKKLYDEGYEIGEGVELDSFTIELVEEVGPVLIYISIFIGIFAFLIIYNFISNSVKIRRKEVGVLRSMGARNSDVIKIFGTEIIIMSIIIYGFSLYNVIDSLSAINSLFNNLVSISIFKGIIIYVVCILFLSIASFLPLYKLLKKNPIDAIRKVF